MKREGSISTDKLAVTADWDRVAPVRNEMNGTLPRFLAVGVANTAVSLAVIVLAREALAFGHIVANAVGYATGLLLSFTLNRAWTFRDSGNVLTTFVRFLLVFAVAYAANLAVLKTTLDEWARTPYLPHLAGMVVYTLTFYVGSRLLVFRNQDR